MEIGPAHELLKSRGMWCPRDSMVSKVGVVLLVCETSPEGRQWLFRSCFEREEIKQTNLKLLKETGGL